MESKLCTNTESMSSDYYLLLIDGNRDIVNQQSSVIIPNAFLKTKLLTLKIFDHFNPNFMIHTVY